MFLSTRDVRIPGRLGCSGATVGLLRAEPGEPPSERVNSWEHVGKIRHIYDLTGKILDVSGFYQQNMRLQP